MGNWETVGFVLVAVNLEVSGVIKTSWDSVENNDFPSPL
jgi:hypothetical protein